MLSLPYTAAAAAAMTHVAFVYYRISHSLLQQINQIKYNFNTGCQTATMRNSCQDVKT